MNNVLQLPPSHADHISYYKVEYLQNLFKDSSVIAQRKYDGERMLIHFDGNHTYCTSRRISKATGRFMENQDRIKDLPTLSIHTNDKFNKIGYTVIDCECYANTWSTAASILHSLPERAKQLQEKVTLQFAAFDILFFDGIDMRNFSYDIRHAQLQIILHLINDKRVHQAEESVVNSLEEAYSLANEFWRKGYEGIVIKPINKTYYAKAAMLKIKKFETVDVIVCGYQLGNGKYSNKIGALKVGYYDASNDVICQISKVNCGTDAERNYWTENFDKLVNNTVIEVKCQEITDKSLRHPVYIRIRNDKTVQMCTKNTIFKDE